MNKPEIVREEHLDFLDDLRESGETNMFGAGQYLQGGYSLDKNEAREILLYWMKTFPRRKVDKQ